MRPSPQKPASATADMRSAMGTGLVGGTRIGEVSPALVHAVATNLVSVMVVVPRERDENGTRERRVAYRHARSRAMG